jgi:hypothetical protein
MTMDRIVYVLGAGFSAPLGLPLMNNFLIKSKDMYFADRDKFQYLDKVYDRIARMSVAKNYFAADLFNIEEILSITEMSSFVAGATFRDEFLQYIRDVILHYTPSMPPRNLPSNWEDFLFGDNPAWTPYGYFVLNLCNRAIAETYVKGARAFVCSRTVGSKASYAVVSLNYDLVLETVCKYVGEQCTIKDSIGFCSTADGNAGPVLAKLHGSIDGPVIVPPTWSKGSHPEIVPAWRSALEVLRTANQIRFIGYSLPRADAYVRYLLKAAVLDAPHLKAIDVICLDPHEHARRSYDEFITFAYYRFVNRSTQEYLQALMPFTVGNGLQGTRARDLEDAHAAFMEESAPAMNSRDDR